MAQVRLEAYIFFKGNAKEAMEFYKSVFGGELTMQTLGESPKEALEQMKIDESRYGEIMHARLDTDGFRLMASDSQKASPEAKKISLSLGGTDKAAMREMFDKLAEGGKVFQPLEKMFWGDVFGSLTDKYGVEWMMNIGDSMG
jgi:PhnB protein